MKNTELLRTQTNAEENQNNLISSEEMITFERVEDTPFSVVKYNDKWTVAIKNAIVSSKDFETKEDAIKYIWEKPYDLIFNGAFTFIKLIEELKEQE
ncbi:hypothetical protein [Microviridae sp.]|nr:hypothetical protein [Microviridae sp.]